jgi:HD superfamily phosphohydrolase
MGSAIEVLRLKGIDIAEEESQAVVLAILLHDIGHGPFSHALEETLIEGIHHEDLSKVIMDDLNQQFSGALDLTIRLFRDQHPRKFLYQLISGQLDMDRLDYLRRDSFFTGVTEGTIGSERIIKMIHVHDDRLVVEEKGIYSIEKFLIARRLMYWQVYLHKAVLSAELLLLKILKRSKELAREGVTLSGTPALQFFLHHEMDARSILDSGLQSAREALIRQFVSLDDNDLITAVKAWSTHEDVVLSMLCERLVNRKLFRAQLQNQPFDEEGIAKLRDQVSEQYRIPRKLTPYFVFVEEVSNHAYDPEDQSIQILSKNGLIQDISQASDMLNPDILSLTAKKYCLCYPKEFIL